MIYEFAPLEGITDHIYRNLHRRFFPGVGRYYTPFIAPTETRRFAPRDKRELLPENNEVPLVPQLLAKDAEHFLWAARELKEMGYREINLNLGCPSGTVVAKRKGAGFLSEPELLDAFFDRVFSAEGIPAVSVKTRLGVGSPDEFPGLLRIYNKYPISGLIVHARTLAEFYKGPAHPEVFAEALAETKIPLCYNGNLFRKEDLLAFSERFPTVKTVMIGRGLVANPALVSPEFVSKEFVSKETGEKERLRAFLDSLREDYLDAFGSRQNTMMRMKAIWFYLIRLFAESGDYAAKLARAKDWSEFFMLTDRVFRELPLDPSGVTGF